MVLVYNGSSTILLPGRVQTRVLGRHEKRTLYGDLTKAWVAEQCLSLLQRFRCYGRKGAPLQFNFGVAHANVFVLFAFIGGLITNFI